MNTENVSTLKIHKLTREQYERELGAGRIDPTAIYLTPNEELLSIEQGGTGANNAADALANLGAAPAGYGLGVATPEKEISDCNLAVRNGWYKVTGNASNAPWTLSSWMRVDAYNENYLVQTIYNEANGGRTAQRLKAGTWGSWVNNSPTDFAPAGFGLGVQFPQSIASLADLDTLTQNGWYVVSASASTLAGVYFNHAMVFVQCRYGSTYQELVPIKSTTKLRRYRYDGTWSEWEVENPPMVAGVEYRTTERSGGKVVYKKLQDGVIHYRLDGETDWKLYSGIVGAAPSGYGYGGQSVALKNNSLIADEDDLDNELAKIYDTMNAGETKMITFFGYPSNSDWRFFGILTKSSANNGSLVAQSAYNRGTEIIKTKYNGTWQPCEWVNPPMVAGVEYRTTERWQGKSVYTTLVDCGIVPNVGIKSVGHGLSIERVLRKFGSLSYFGIAAPYMDINQFSNANPYLDISANKTAIFVKCGTSTWETAGYTVLAQIYYTKP